jgi:hypothetical protein
VRRRRADTTIPARLRLTRPRKRCPAPQACSPSEDRTVLAPTDHPHFPSWARASTASTPSRRDPVSIPDDEWSSFAKPPIAPQPQEALLHTETTAFPAAIGHRFSGVPRRASPGNKPFPKFVPAGFKRSSRWASSFARCHPYSSNSLRGNPERCIGDTLNTMELAT